MSVSTAAIRPRIDRTPTTLLAAVGDVVAIGLFVLVGELSHGVDPLATPLLVLDTLAPFVVGWVLVALFGGLYTADAWRSPRRVVTRTFPAWLVADGVAQLLRATSLFHGSAAFTFYLVSAVVGGSFLVGWRLAVATHSGGAVGERK